MGLSHTRRVTVFVVLAMCMTVAIGAQDAEFRAADNPYQEEFAYQLGQELTPNVEIEGVRWMSVRLRPRDEGEIDPEKDDVDVVLSVAFDNRGTDDARVQVIVLLEDDAGRPLDRLSVDPIRVRDGRTQEADEKFRVPGASLLAVGRIYLFLELER